MLCYKKDIFVKGKRILKMARRIKNRSKMVIGFVLIVSICLLNILSSLICATAEGTVEANLCRKDAVARTIYEFYVDDELFSTQSLTKSGKNSPTSTSGARKWRDELLL